MKLNTSIRKRFRVSNKVKKVASKDRFRLSISRSSKNISAEIFFDDLDILNLNLSFEATFLTLLLTLNLFLILVFNFITFSYPLF